MMAYIGIVITISVLVGYIVHLMSSWESVRAQSSTAVADNIVRQHLRALEAGAKEGRIDHTVIAHQELAANIASAIDGAVSPPSPLPLWRVLVQVGMVALLWSVIMATFDHVTSVDVSGPRWAQVGHGVLTLLWAQHLVTVAPLGRRRR